jgi:hypothetical protein
MGEDHAKPTMLPATTKSGKIKLWENIYIVKFDVESQFEISYK